MFKLEKVQEGEEILGVLTERHIALREDSIAKSRAFKQYQRKVERRLLVLHEEHHDEEKGCPVECDIVRPTEEEARTVHNLKYEADLANMLLWKVLNDDFKAWEKPVGMRLDDVGREVLVKLVPRRGIGDILGMILG